MSLLIRDIHTLLTGDTVLNGAFIYIEGGVIRQIGTTRPPQAGQVISARHSVAIPGLVNTHHHLYQTLTRAYAPAADVELFDWLRTLYPIWARLDEEAVYTAALVGMAELLLSGCTTTTDHHYVFPRGHKELIDAQIAAARKIGIRFHPTRGSMSVGKSEGGLPPDSVVQRETKILEDSERLIRKYHDPSPGSMLRIALAPCSPFSVSPQLMRDTASLAARHGVRLHTHLAETRDEEAYCLERFQKRPLDLLESVGWLSDQTWLAHGIFFNRAEIKRLGRARVGIAHCPTSNMRLGSGCAPVLALRQAGCPVGLGVDGSASNDSSHMLAEARQALLLHRLQHGAAAITVRDALEMATIEGARCLGRDDIGSLEEGKRADIALFDLRGIGFSGAGDPLSALLLCAPAQVDALIVEGRIIVERGELKTIPLNRILARHRKLAAALWGSLPAPGRLPVGPTRSVEKPHVSDQSHKQPRRGKVEQAVSPAM
ncbi:MAG TPA: 8-oxoguanine deaminase [Bryobacteraceae bacterium]|nr:8-oxoguanine deaminase [Bryobacteraceae bacterium]